MVFMLCLRLCCGSLLLFLCLRLLNKSLVYTLAERSKAGLPFCFSYYDVINATRLRHIERDGGLAGFASFGRGVNKP